ncbi:MAG: hypothetical protein WCR36_10895 [Bacteroidaceae bacterium]
MKATDFFDDKIDEEQTILFIKRHIPQELQEKFDNDTLTYIIDLIDEYYVESGILESEPDEDGFVDLDLEKVAKYVVKESKKDPMQETFIEDEILLVVQAELEYTDQLSQQ